MWQAEERAVAAVDDDQRGARPAHGHGRHLAGDRPRPGAGRVRPRRRRGRGGAAGQARSAPMLALLVLLPLALGEVAASLADAGALAARTRAAEDRLAAIAARPPAVADPERPLPTPAGSGLALDGVAAAWDGREVLRDLDLVLAEGERVAVVGPTGCGKSTLAALLLRFVDPVRGRVSLAGAALPELALDDVRRTVGLVDDDPHVFATTLGENVRLARPGVVRPRRRGGAAPGPAGRLAGRAARRPGQLAGRRARRRVRVASGPGSRSPARCSPTSRCWCSTSRPRTSTARRPTRWRRRSSTAGTGARSSGSRTPTPGSTAWTG